MALEESQLNTTENVASCLQFNVYDADAHYNR